MNFYRKYPGDFAGKTKHLSLLERGAYNELLDFCYQNETDSLPGSDPLLYRICGAYSRPERSAVRAVAREFFPGGVNSRIRQQLPEELRRRDVARDNGALGGRPPKGTQRVIKTEPSGLAGENPALTQRVSQTITSLNPEPCTSQKAKRLQPAAVVGIPETSNSDPPPPLDCEKGNGRLPNCPHQAIIDLYHEVLPMCPGVRVWTRGRQIQLAQRWREDADRQDVNWWKGYFGHVAESSFLTGRAKTPNGRHPFVANLGWLVKLENLAKVYEGQYDD